jgi:hypothetical protein
MLKHLNILLIIVLLASCNSQRHEETKVGTTSVSTTEKEQTPATSEFQNAFAKFFDALKESDTTMLNQFIHPEYGLWVIEQPGAMPKMTQVYDIRKFGREYQNRSFFTIASEIKQCDLTEEPLPTFDCGEMDYDAGKSGYSKDGCFVWKAEKFSKTGYWDYASLTPTQLQSINATLPLVQKSVLHTATSFEFHFGNIDNRWYLLFTKIIYPCSA